MAQATCSLPGCKKPVKGRGWCGTHYARWRAHGDPLGGRWRTYGAKRSITAQGYVRIWQPDHALAHSDGYVLEHQKVLYDLGLLWPRGWNVHHINENRTDNRPENLAIMAHGAHRRHHMEANGYVENQFGVWPLR